MDISQVSTKAELESRKESWQDSQAKVEHALTERLFARFGAIYGAKLAQQWSGVDPDELKSTWYNALRRFDPHQIGRAISQCEENVKTPPTLPQFIELVRTCYQEPAKPLPYERQLDAPRERGSIASAAEQTASREYPKSASGFGVWWACRIVRLAQLGEYPHFHGLHSAMNVLELKNINELQEKYPPHVTADKKEADDERQAIQADNA